MDNLIRSVQAALGVTADGKAGPKTWRAIHDALVSEPAAEDEGLIDERSEKVIATLLPEVRPYARCLVREAAKIGIDIKVLSGLRTYEEQNKLYEKGRSEPGRIVTKARAGYSNHNFGIAFDIGVFEGPAYLGDSPKYAAVGALASAIGLEWGGNWVSFKDMPHYQLRPKWAVGMGEAEMLKVLRQRKDAGINAFS